MTAATDSKRKIADFEPPPHLFLDAAVERVLQRVRLKAKCRSAWLQHLWDNEGQSRARHFIDHNEIAGILADRDAPGHEAQWLAANEALAPVYRELSLVEKAMEDDQSSRLAVLGKIFALSGTDTDLLHTALAVAVDPSLARLYAYLHDHPNRGYVSEELIKRLYGYGRGSVIASDSPLRLWRLIREADIAPGEPGMFSIDTTVKDWLLGENPLDPVLIGRARLIAPVQPLAQWPVEACAATAKRHLKDGTALRIIISGVSGSGRRSLAAAVAAQLGMTLLAVDADDIATDSWSDQFLHAQRQAFLAGQALCWSGQAPGNRPWPAHLVPFPLQFVTVEPDQAPPVCRGLVDHRVDMPPLSIDERRQLWGRYIPKSAMWDEEGFARLVEQHQSTTGEIANVAASQIDSLEEAAQYLRECSRYRLGDLAQHVDCPFNFDDLVLPQRVADLLKDFMFEARDRAAFWEDNKSRRLFPQGRGHMALFSGPSGTGKTMSAQVIAANLGLDLFRIDLSAVVSKYVGETSKNLQRILSRAQGMDLVLLFDEADALLGKRTEIKDAHDRFANTDTNYLLQALEDYQGLAILSTNRKGNIDDAFLRRFRYVIEFPQPDTAQRQELWHRLAREMIGELPGQENANAYAELQKDINNIAAGVELTGAQIKFSLLAALFNARRHQQFPGIQHLLHGIDRELMKEGRVLSDRQRQRLHGNASN